MKRQHAWMLCLLLLLLAGCVHILIPVPIFIPIKTGREAAVQTPTQPATQAISQTASLPITSATSLTTTASATVTTTATAALTTTQTISSEHLAQALALTPADARAVYFTDWTLIKQYKNVPTLNSKSPVDQQTAFLFSLSKDQAAPNVYGARAFLRFADTWSWNSTDLAWEVAIDSIRAPVHILKFRDDFNFAPVLAHFQDRDFQQQLIDGTRVYTHEEALTEDWFKIGESSIANTAVISDEKLLVLSSEITSVQTVLDLYHQKATALTGDADLRSTIAGLGAVAAAIVTPGIDTCRGLSFDAISQQLLQTKQITETQVPTLKEQLLSDAQFHIYSGFALGYRYTAGKPLGLLVMHYPNAADAQADLEPRRIAAATRASLVASAAYTDTLFALDTAAVVGNNLVFQLHPHEDQPARLFQMFFYRDMAFAGCP